MATAPLGDEVSAPPVGPGRLPWVWMYHSVDVYQQDPHLLTVMPARFERQMKWLAANGLRGVGVAELLDAHARGQAASLVGLTFDDGYADFARHAMPILAERGFGATVYVPAGRIGGHNAWDGDAPRKALLDARRIRELADAGIEFGSHGLMHVRQPQLSPAHLLAETGRSKEILEAVTGRPVHGFCYPYGALDRTAVAAVREAGYHHACGIGRSALTGRWALPRAYIGDRDGALRLWAKRAQHLLRGLRRSRGPTDDHAPTAPTDRTPA